MDGYDPLQELFDEVDRPPAPQGSWVDDYVRDIFFFVAGAFFATAAIALILGR